MSSGTLLPRVVAELAASDLAPDSTVESIAEWLVSPSGLRHHPARSYLFYLKLVYESFHAVEEGFRLMREARGESPHGATSALELLHMANHLYVAVSHDLPGVVLECGAFKGFSACCLSHACSLIGRRLVVADSFRGLPEPGADDPDHYSKGDLCGSLDEVCENLESFGRPEVVEFHQGYYEDSLSTWDRPVALLWMDVDLFESARAVLEGVYPHLSTGAAVFSHEFLPSYVRDGSIIHDREPPGAIATFLSEKQREYRAEHIAGCLGVVTLEDTLGRGSHELLGELLPHLRDSDHRARAAAAAIGLRPALADFVRRRLGFGD